MSTTFDFKTVFDCPEEMDVNVARLTFEKTWAKHNMEIPQIETLDEDMFWDNNSNYINKIYDYLKTIAIKQDIVELNWLVRLSYKHNSIRNLLNEFIDSCPDNGLIVCYIGICIHYGWKEGVLCLLQNNFFPSLYETCVLSYFIYRYYNDYKWFLALIKDCNLINRFSVVFKSSLFFYSIICGDFNQIVYFMSFREKWWPTWQQVKYLLKHWEQISLTGLWDIDLLIENGDDGKYWKKQRKICLYKVHKMFIRNNKIQSVLDRSKLSNLTIDIVSGFLYSKCKYDNDNAESYPLKKMPNFLLEEHDTIRYYQYFTSNKKIKLCENQMYRHILAETLEVEQDYEEE
jgi:hypothetical protein